jgi:dTDP-4-dehydrorhamnose 3,5-epimerase-like enzyme
MTRPELRISVLKDFGDIRGSSFQPGPELITFLGNLADMHIASILPGCIRGNHFHIKRREVILVIFADDWRVAWDQGTDTQVTVKSFSGFGAAVVEVDPYASHAVANTGKALLWVIGLSNGSWDACDPDSYPRIVLPAPN